MDVVVEMTICQRGRRRAISRTSGRSSRTSPTLTAWNQRQGWSPILQGASPQSFSLQPSRYLPVRNQRYTSQGAKITKAAA